MATFCASLEGQGGKKRADKNRRQKNSRTEHSEHVDLYCFHGQIDGYRNF